MIARIRTTFGGAVAALALCLAASPAAQAQGTTLANPASQNCAAKGGKVVIEKNGKGAQYGVCLFPDNLQCEEWAMMRGECPTGGIKVTGYVNRAARYCAITGGSYTVTAESNTPRERGTCAFPNGKTCGSWAYFNGSCTREARAAAPANTIKAMFACTGGKTIDATFVNGAKSSVRLALSDGRKMTLPQAMSADGARYANAKETVVFWNKGNTAFLQENGKSTYEGCATKS